MEGQTVMYERPYYALFCAVRLPTNPPQEVPVSTHDLDDSVRVFDSRDDRLPRLPVLAAGGSLAAAAVHAWVVRSHATHWWGYAAFFAGLAVAQAVFAVVFLRRPSRALVRAGIAANLGVLALYAWSRIVAVPFGPHAGRPEVVAAPDLLAAGAELLTVIALVALSRGVTTASFRIPVRKPAMTAILAGLVAAGMAGPMGHAHPRAEQITLASGPETWVGPLPTPTIIAEETPAAEPSFEPEPVVEEAPACDPKVASGITAPGPSAPGSARAVVASTYAETGPQFWMYIPSTDEKRKLLAQMENCSASGPSFRDPGYISFHSDGDIYGLDLSSGDIERLVDTKSGVMAAAWSPDGKTLAYLEYDWSDHGPQLVVLDVVSGSKEVVRTFEDGGGRCGGEDDESTLAWSPDGRALLAVMTFLDFSEKTMFVMDETGKDLVEPRLGTHARWAPDSKRIYYRDFSGDRKWYALNAWTGDRGTLSAMKPGTHGLAVSQDGTLLAYHDGEDDVGIYVYDVVQKEQRRVAENAVSPLWIGPRTILVTDTKSCGNECFHSAWTWAGSASIVDVVTEEKDQVTLDSTLNAEAWLEPPADENPSPAPSPPSTPVPSPTETPADDPLPLPSPTTEPSTEPTATPTPTPTSST